jgi:DNA-binding transcriptional LysR family regulator
VAGALGAISAATDDVRQGVRNSLYVHCQPQLCQPVADAAVAANFAQAHPGISLFLSASPTHSDFALGQADLDIRYGVPRWPDLVVQPLFEEPILPLASPAFMAAPPLACTDRAAGTPLIQSTVSVVQWADWLATRGIAQRPSGMRCASTARRWRWTQPCKAWGWRWRAPSWRPLTSKKAGCAPVFDLTWAVRVQAHFRSTRRAMPSVPRWKPFSPGLACLKAACKDWPSFEADNPRRCT